MNPYLAFETISDLIRQDVFLKKVDYKTAEKNFIKACHKGVLKIMSKMGISTLQSYRGAQIFEAVGLRQDFVDEYFSWTPSPLGGIGIEELEAEAVRRHIEAYPKRRSPAIRSCVKVVTIQWRRDGEYHMYNPDCIARLQYATQADDYNTYQEFADLIDNENRRLCTIRGLLDFKAGPSTAIPIDEVEPAREIVQAVRHRRHLPGLDQPRGPRDPGHRHEPHPGRAATPARAARTITASSPTPTATAARARSSRSPPAASG